MSQSWGKLLHIVNKGHRKVDNSCVRVCGVRAEDVQHCPFREGQADVTAMVGDQHRPEQYGG